MNDELTRRLLQRVAALERRLGIQETIEASATHSHTDYINKDGSTPLTGDWDAGAFTIQADTLAATDANGLLLRDDGGNEGLTLADGGGCTIKVARLYGSQLEAVSLADDVAMSFSPPALGGIFVLFQRLSPSVPAREAQCMAAYRTTSVSYMQIISQPSTSIEATTGALTNGSGTDGKLTISAHTDNLIYISNRLGVSIEVSAVFLR